MLIKFFRNGRGAGAGPVGYLVADKVLAYDDNRDLIRDVGCERLTLARVSFSQVLLMKLEHATSIFGAQFVWGTSTTN